jgi:outer membrane protein OmpA-like peptidoglycan-associated protein
MPVVHFDKRSVRPRPDNGALDYVVKAMQKPTSVCALAQVQGHASADESDAPALSLARARAIVARLVRRGIAPARLAAHGLGTRFPALPPNICPAGVPRDELPTDCINPPAPAAARPPARDRRVEIFCLRRHWVPGPSP